MRTSPSFCQLLSTIYSVAPSIQKDIRNFPNDSITRVVFVKVIKYVQTLYVTVLNGPYSYKHMKGKF
jgi:hypothetical protein